MIDKKITLGLLPALLIESAGVFAWAGGTAERLREVETAVAVKVAIAERQARVEVKVDQAAAQLARIERKPFAR